MTTVKNLSLDEMTSSRNFDTEKVKQIMIALQEDRIFAPVVVDIDRHIIDGLHRVAAFRSLGEVVIPGIVATTFEEACEGLAVNHDSIGETPSALRTWEIYGDLRKMSQAYALVIRNSDRPRGRDLLAEALGMRESTLGCITAFYSNLLNGPPERRSRAAEIREKLESGERSPAWAIAYIGAKTVSLRGEVTDARRQREAITQVVASLNGALRGLSALGPLASGLGRDELKAWMRDFGQSRRTLAQFINLLEECRKNA